MSARGYAADDADTITKRIAEIKIAETPMCPQNSDRKLSDCLRSTTPCGETCKFRGDWLGPEK